jgi:hypothetical protein
MRFTEAASRQSGTRRARNITRRRIGGHHVSVRKFCGVAGMFHRMFLPNSATVYSEGKLISFNSERKGEFPRVCRVEIASIERLPQGTDADVRGATQRFGVARD